MKERVARRDEFQVPPTAAFAKRAMQIHQCPPRLKKGGEDSQIKGGAPLGIECRSGWTRIVPLSQDLREKVMKAILREMSRPDTRFDIGPASDTQRLE